MSSFAYPGPFADISTPVLFFLKLFSPSLPNFLLCPDQCERAELVVVLWTLPRTQDPLCLHMCSLSLTWLTPLQTGGPQWRHCTFRVPCHPLRPSNLPGCSTFAQSDGSLGNHSKLPLGGMCHLWQYFGLSHLAVQWQHHVPWIYSTDPRGQ